jgi:UDP-N-acetylglucosamine:LPS N-acetylglucosamine transferase
MSIEQPAILILTTHTGGGHLNLAQSLKSMLETRCDVAIVNPQPGFVDRWYALASRHSLKYLEWQYILTNTAVAARSQHLVMTPFSRGHICDLLERYRPRLVITTHALLSYVTARAIEHVGQRIPLVFQLTDLERLHATWFTEKRAAAYLAPTTEIFAQALRHGIGKSRLHLTGRPVRRQFLEVSPQERSQTIAALGFNPAIFTLFLQGGAKGSAGIDRIITNMLNLDVPVQIILAAGTNSAMAPRYAGVERVRVLPYTDLLAPSMAVADIIAGKAGASFITEAFMLEKPFLATTCIPGQETPNLRFIERYNLGWVCLEPAGQRELLAALARHPGIIAEKTASIRDYKAWNTEANQAIVPVIDRLLA